MKIKIEKYYVCSDCGRKTLVHEGFPTGWMLLLVGGKNRWEVLCPASHVVNKYGITTTNTTNTMGYPGKIEYNYFPNLKNDSKAEFLEHMDDEEDDDEPE